MSKTKDFNTQITKNIDKALEFATKKQYLECILIELETNRLIHEQNYTELAILIANNNKKLTNLDKKVDKLQDILVKLQENKSFWSKIKSIFNK